MDRVVTTKRPPDVAEIVDSLGAVLAGDKPDQRGLGDAFWGAFTHSLATSVHRAFLDKSAHGRDELGGQWDDLLPKTKAYSRKDARKGLPLHRGKPTKAGNKARPTLTKEQDRAWRKMFVQRLADLRAIVGEEEAKRRAAQIAWEYVKDELGASTILEYARDRIIPLLQKTGRLEKSLRPGNFSGEEYQPPAEQVYRRSQRSLTWGTSVEYASRVSEKRPLWPDNIDVWIKRALDSGINAVVKKLKDVL